MAMLSLSLAVWQTILEKMKTLHNIEGLDPSKIRPTIGLNIANIAVQDSKLKFWDLGGQASLRGIWEKYLASACAVVFVIDACDIDRREESMQTLKKLLQDHRLEDIPVALFLNHAVDNEPLGIADIHAFIVNESDKREMAAFSVSAKNGYVLCS